jgi:hypothetical protein
LPRDESMSTQAFKGRGLTVVVALVVAAILLLVVASQWLIRRPRLESASSVLAEAPCVGPVCLGDTGREATVELLSEHELLSSIRDGGGRVVDFFVTGGGIGNIYFRQDESGRHEIIETINIRAYGMTLSHALQALGQPTELFLMFGCGHGYHVHGKLFYPERGVEVQLQFQVKLADRAQPVILTERTPVLSIWYFEPEKYADWLSGIPEDLDIRSGYFVISADLTAEALAAAVKPWPGLNAPIEALDTCPR